MTDKSLINICFHGIGNPGRELEPGESRYWISVQQFDAILDEIALWPSLRISFDDGNHSDVEFGLPALAKRGLKATFFVLAGRLGEAGSIDTAGIAELSKAGMTIGTHGMGHRSWRGMDASTEQMELMAARRQIAEVARCSVDEAALPLGQYDRRLLYQLKRLGYQAVHTSDRRQARAGSWLQPRFSVRAEDTAQTLRRQVKAARRIDRKLKLEAVGAIKRFR